MPLDPFLAAMLQELAKADGPAMTDVPPPAAREMFSAMQSAALVKKIKSISNSTAGNIPIRVYRESDEATPAVVYYHGGGWVIGDLDSHDSFCTQIAEATGYTVISVEYRLAPEHPYPAPLDDCYDALCWIQDNASDLNINADKIAVAGDSAGGNLAAAVCLKARAQGNSGISMQLLLYPVTDCNYDTPSYLDNAEGYMLTREGMVWFWDHYIGEDENLKADPLVSPLRAQSMEGLPAACIITAEFDPLRDEGNAYAERLKSAGVATDHQCVDGVIHGFFDMQENLAGARSALAFAAESLKRHLG